MVYMPDGANVYMRLLAFKFSTCHKVLIPSLLRKLIVYGTVQELQNSILDLSRRLQEAAEERATLTAVARQREAEVARAQVSGFKTSTILTIISLFFTFFWSRTDVQEGLMCRWNRVRSAAQGIAFVG